MNEPVSLPLGYVLRVFDSLPSTMDEAHRLAGEGAPEGTIVLASRQTKARGRLGRTWASLPGNLSFSLILRPDFSMQEATALGFIFSLAIAHALVALVPPSLGVSCKWPNDVLICERKVAGILLEVEPSLEGPSRPPAWIVVGVGVNLAQHPAGTSFPAVSLASLGASVTRSQLLSAVCLELQALLRLWRGQGFKAIRTLWLGRAWGLQRELAVVRGREKIQGVFEDLGLDGSLILRGRLGDRLHVPTGEVLFASNFV